MTAAATTPDKTPEWMLLLEKKKNRPHRLAHEIGAGAPCLACGDGCPGLDLHFWRKVCRNCKCTKEVHDVKDDDGYEQFEILLGAGGKRKKPGAVLKIKVAEASNSAVVVDKKGVPFDWVPPNVTDDIAAEYMQQLPAAKLPISGSDGALYRRQQLERQMPLHDLDAARCHNLTAQEIEELQKYLDNLKSNVVGQGRVTKVPALYTEQQHTYRGPSHEQASSMPTSHSYQSLPLPPLPNKYNAVPRPFQSRATADNDPDLPPPLPTSNPPDFHGASLKTPSSFVPTSGSLLSAQHPRDIAHSSDVAGQMYPGATRPYGPSTTSQPGSLASQQYSHDVAHSSDVAGQIYPGATRPYDPCTTSQPGSLASQQYSRDIAHSSDVAGQMYPGATRPYGPSATSQPGSHASQQYSHDIAHSSDVTGQMYPGATRPYGPSATSQQGSLSLQQYSHDIAHSSDVGGQMYPGATRPYGPSTTSQQGPLSSLQGSLSSQQNLRDVTYSSDVNSGGPGYARSRNADGTYSAFPQDASSVPSQCPSSVAHSADIPQHLVPGFSQPLASGREVPATMTSSQNRHNAPNSANIKNLAPGLAGVTNAQGHPMTGFPIEGSSIATKNRYDIPNSSGYNNMAPGLIGNQTFPQDGSIQASENRHNAASSTTFDGKLSPEYSNIQHLRGNSTSAFPQDSSQYGSHRPNANSSNSNKPAPRTSDLQNIYGNPSSTNAEGLSSQYRNSTTNPTRVPDQSALGSAYQHTAGTQPNSQFSPGDECHTFSNSDHRSDIDSSAASQMPNERYSQIPEAVRFERMALHPDISSSSEISGDSMPRSAHMIQQLSSALNNAQLELLSAEELPVASHLNCQRCEVALVAGEVAVFADRAGANAAWHPKCFVCNTCDELLVDLIYFFSKGGVYCGRHFAELLDIPRCYACDELIFVKEYTVAEGKTFHVKHFCCYECDDPLAGKQYIPADDQPTCLDCYQEIFGKRCHTCRKQIPAGHQRVGWKELNWHAEADCFRCSGCSKSLLGGKFVMREQQPFCNKDCVALLAAGKQ